MGDDVRGLTQLTRDMLLDEINQAISERDHARADELRRRFERVTDFQAQQAKGMAYPGGGEPSRTYPY